MQYDIEAAMALAAGAEETLIRATTPASRRGRISRIRCGDRSVTPTDEPVLVRVYRGNTGAAGTGTAFTPVLPYGSASGTVLSTLAVNFSVEPATTSREPLTEFLCPTGSSIELFFNERQGPILECAVSSNISIVVISPQTRALLFTCEVTFAED